MREVKFRGWDKHKKKMYSAEEMGQDELTISPDGRGFVNVNGSSQRLSQYMHHILPLQFTGMKDKNGKDIYEGDIVRLKYYGINDSLKNQIVIFKDGKWQTNHWRTGKYLDFDGCEIIGNEFERIVITKGAQDST